MMRMRPPQQGQRRQRSGRLLRLGRFWRGRHGQEFAGAGEAGLAGGAGEQTIVADAVEAARQDMQQEAAHELVGVQRHDLLALRPAAAIILVAEGDAALVER